MKTLPKNVQNFRVSPEQQKALCVLISSGSQREAAQEAGVTDRTIRQWLQLPAFSHALRTGQLRALEAAALRTGSLLHASMDAIERGLADGDVRIQIKAAEVFLSKEIALLEFVNIEGRLRAVEDRLVGPVNKAEGFDCEAKH